MVPRVNNTTEEGSMVTQREYYESVKTIAELAIDETAEGNFDDISDAVHEMVDGSEWVIYTYRAQKVLEYSGNEEAGPDSLGWEDFVSGAMGWSCLYSRGAYYAMVQDVHEAVDERWAQE